MKLLHVEAMNSYRKEFNKFVEEKQDESGDIGGVVIAMDSEKGMSIPILKE